MNTLKSADRQPRAGYHHGDLRQQCVQAGLLLLRESGPEGVSLREVARRCGVTPRAPYRHFADKDAFLASLAVAGFADFGARLSRVQRRFTSAPPERRLQELAQTYIRFAHQHPALMGLMFGDDFSDRKQTFPELDRAALATFALLQAEIARIAPGADAVTLRQGAAAAWALVHGLSELLGKGQMAHVLQSASELRALTPMVVRLLGRAIANASA